MEKKDMSVLSMAAAEEAFSIVNGGRQEDYGKPERSFEALAKVWTGILQSKLAPGAEISPADVALLMCGLKIVRETNRPKRDNVVDLHGYTFLYERLAGHDTQS